MPFPTPDAVPAEDCSTEATLAKFYMDTLWGLDVVDEQTAARFLYILRRRPLPTYWPQDMETEEGFDQTVSHFRLVPLLRVVHERKVYAWLGTEILTPTLQDYLFPNLSNVLSIVRPPVVGVGPDQNNSTAQFQPRLLEPDALPASSEIFTDLPTIIRVELEQIVRESGLQHSKISRQAAEFSDGLLVYTEDSFAICMPRASDLSSTLPEPTVSFEILLTGKPRQGGSGHVYRTATRYVLKLANGTQASKQMLLDELKWYDVLASAGIQAVSRCHGLFRSGNDIALVLDDKGEELLDFDGLDSDQRKHLYWSLCSIHRAGVTHGDFEPRNVVVQADPWQSSTFLILGITNVKEKMLAQS
ncbi:SubName: Full=Uncharacterized protein {ECO:0000313/EMBL:CCA74003.1} [Serendipita indica DSM 11827]|nr:SubName: Full=Uncharacterized protein {ECO:0000313/EMBL:CCA74003.1} [Serendipita indica DSM 11827]